VKQKHLKYFAFVVLLGAIMMLGACKKSRSGTSATTSAATRSDRFDCGESKHYSARTVG